MMHFVPIHWNTDGHFDGVIQFGDLKPGHCRLGEKIRDFFVSVADLLYRELHFDWIVDYMRDEAHELVDAVRESFGATFVDLIREKQQKLKFFIVDMDDRIHNAITDVCVDGQPENFWVDPVHYMICSWTVEQAIRHLEEGVFQPVIEKTSKFVYLLDEHIMGTDEGLAYY